MVQSHLVTFILKTSGYLASQWSYQGLGLWEDTAQELRLGAIESLQSRNFPKDPDEQHAWVTTAMQNKGKNMIKAAKRQKRTASYAGVIELTVANGGKVMPQDSVVESNQIVTKLRKGGSKATVLFIEAYLGSEEFIIYSKTQDYRLSDDQQVKRFSKTSNADLRKMRAIINTMLGE